MTKYINEYSVICSDIDLNSQMRPIATPVYFQDCYIRYAAKNYFATFDLEPKNLYWFITDYNIQLTEDLPYWSENFSVQIWISKITKLKVIVDFVYTHNSKTFAQGTSTWVIFDKNIQKPVLTDVLFKDYTEIEEPLIEMQEKILWNKVKNPVRTIEHTATMADLDFNGHVNNRSYVNIAMITASKEFQEKYFMKKLAVKFLQQAYMNDKLTCTSYATEHENEYITDIKVQDKEICKISTAWELKTKPHAILNCDLKIRN